MMMMNGNFFYFCTVKNCSNYQFDFDFELILKVFLLSNVLWEEGILMLITAEGGRPCLK